jgi:hypothetical protein
MQTAEKQVQAEERIKKAPEGTKCCREVRLDQAGKPVHCTSKAMLIIRDKALCQKHANETMMSISYMAKSQEAVDA